MALSRDDILLHNIREALALYQRSLVWAMTAALSGCLIAMRLRGPNPGQIEILSGTLSAPTAWAVAQAVYLIFGALALAAVRRYEAALTALNPAEDLLQAIRMYPSLATLPSRFFRFGSVLLPPFATIVSWTLELWREWTEPSATADHPWIALPVMTAILLGPYIGILAVLRKSEVTTFGQSPIPPQGGGNASGSGDAA